jgi:hypothetical protein
MLSIVLHMSSALTVLESNARPFAVCEDTEATVLRRAMAQGPNADRGPTPSDLPS